MSQNESIMIRPRNWFPEIHDISAMDPLALGTLLSLLPEPAREKASVLVVPNWDKKFPLLDSLGLVRELCAHPGEIVLHGLTHTASSNAFNRLWFGTQNHSEFKCIGLNEAENRLLEAMGIFKQALEREPGWFCAPRWQGSSGLTDILWKHGFSGLMTRGGYLLASGEFLRLPVVSFDHGKRPAVRLGARLIRNALVRRLLKSRQAFRLALHPADLADPEILREMDCLCRQLEHEDWTPLSISDIMHS